MKYLLPKVLCVMGVIAFIIAVGLKGIRQDAAIAELQAKIPDVSYSTPETVVGVLWAEFSHRHQIGLFADSANIAKIDSLVIAWALARETP